MDIQTQRFGEITFRPEEVITFSPGIKTSGLESLRYWILVGDAADSRLYWLQSVTSQQIAIPVVELTEDTPVPIPAFVMTAIEATTRTPLLVLGEVCDEVAGITDGSDRFIVNTEQLRGWQLKSNTNYPAWSSQPQQTLPFRKSA